MTQEHYDALEALAMMYEQYCCVPTEHEPMSSAETAEELLVSYDLLSPGRLGQKINWKKMYELRATIIKPTQHA